MVANSSKSPTPPTSTDRIQRWALYVSVLVGIVQFVYVLVTFGMLKELTKSNRIAQRTQALTLRAYLVTDNTLNTIGFIHPRAADESWLVTTGVGNRGALPALATKINAWIDERRDNFEVPLPANIEQSDVPPNSASIATVNTTKVDAIGKLARGGCFLHVNAYYEDQDHKQFKVVATYALNYAEGKGAGWVLIQNSAN